jgi:hypothetical protein
VNATDPIPNPPVQWLLVATAAFSLGAVIDYPVTSVLATCVALIAIVFAFRRVPFVAVDHGVLGGLLAFVVVVVANTQELSRFSVQPGSYRLWTILALASSVVAALSGQMRIRNLAVILALVTLIVGSLSILIPNWQPTASSDVYRAHFAAGNALSEGENPYSDSVVFESGDPNKPDGTLVEGYPYTPPVLLGYGVLATFTDARVISLASWLAFAIGLAVMAVRSDSLGSTALAALVLVATMPIWRSALFLSWTEPLSVALIAGSLGGISRGRRWGWYLLGIAQASKQYLVFLVPVVLLYRDGAGKRPGWISLGTAAVVAGFPALFGVSAYYDSVIGNALAIGFRPDTQSINGAIAALGGDLLLPTLMVLPLFVGIWIALLKVNLPRAMLTAAGVASLSAALLVTSAFPNYWMLVAALAGLSALTGMTDDKDRWGEPPEPSRGEMDVSISGDQVTDDPMPRDL